MNVSTREFQLNQKEYLERVSAGEEIVLTNRNIPVAHVVKEIKNKSVDEEQIRMIVKMVLEETSTHPVEREPDFSTPPIETPVKLTSIPGVVKAEKLKVDPAVGFCELHYDVKGPHKRTMCTWEDEHGTPLVEKKWICDDCVTKYENMGRGHLYFL
jgi:prevent-host-death family protein